MDFDEIWEILMTRKNSSVVKELPELLIVEDSFSSKEYYLTHMYEDSFYEFQGLDSENNSYHIRMLPLQSYDDVKTAYKNISMLRDHTESCHLVPINNLFEIYDDHWVLVIVSELMEGLTLSEISENMENCQLPKEIGVMAYTRLIEIIEKSFEAGIILNISPETIIFYKQESTDSSIFSTENSRYNIKLITSSQLPRYSKSKYEVLFSGKRYSLENEIWGAALVLFLFFSHRALEGLMNLKDLEEEEKVNLLSCSDSIVSNLVLSSFRQQKSNILGNNSIKIWKHFLDNSWDQLGDYLIKDIAPLLTVLKFNTNSALLAAAKKILMVANEYPAEVSKSFSNLDFLIDFFVIVKNHVDFYKYPSLVNSVLAIFKEKIASIKVKQGLINAGFLGLIDDHWLNHAKSELMCKFAMEFIDNSTFTILQILWDRGFIDGLVKKQVKSANEVEFIKLTMSFYGPHSITLSEKCAEMIEFGTLRLLQYIYEIPVSFKINRIPQLLNAIKTLTRRKTKSGDDNMAEIIKSLIFNINELFLVPQFIQKQHIEGNCTNKSENKFLEFFSKSPLIVRCSQCKYTTCMSCFDKFHKSHDPAFQLNSVFRCAEIHKWSTPGQAFHVSINPNLGPLDLQEYQKFDSSLLIGKSFASLGLPSSKDFDPYFEIYINRNASNERFYFGFLGTGIIYRGDTGVIYRNSHPIGLGPKLGSYDTVGVGLKDSKVFFTYNGLLLKPFYECFPASTIQAYYGYSSEDPCEVEIRTQDLIFKAPSYENLASSADTNEIISFIFRKINKLHKKKDPRINDLVEKFMELSFSLKKEKLHHKTMKLLPKD